MYIIIHMVVRCNFFFWLFKFLLHVSMQCINALFIEIYKKEKLMSTQQSMGFMITN